ncbi:hypothetical protein LCGC14_1204830 [marine sediment metagenome]|uniref:Uncharacterized protein n=1 Tax=marine sediment metagenome TaxID=412755 RepID=A0A0F9LFW9_9ZZZZ
MANNSGKFIADNLMNQKIEIFMGLDNEWIAYADGDVQSYTIIVAIPIDFDDESGILTLTNDRGQEFYLSENNIQIFWKEGMGFKLIENTSSTIRTGKQWLKGPKGRDIM